jgi:DNA-binding winged helix-turn-helix (wHTH) protein
VANASHFCIQFDGFFLNPKERLLFRGEDRISLGGKDFDLLVFLAGRPNVLLTHNELMDGVWGPETFIQENNISVHIAKIREALGDGFYIETVHGQKGYRFVGHATRVPCSPTLPDDIPSLAGSREGGLFTVECHKFVPVYLGRNAHADLPGAAFRSSWSEHTVVEKEEATLHVLSLGVGVWHLRHKLAFPTLTDLASWRRRTYREIIEDRHLITTSTSEVLATLESDASDPLAFAVGKLGYVLSLMALNEPLWDDPDRLRTAIKILSCLTPLQVDAGDEQAREEAIRLENELLGSGFNHKDVVEFGVSGNDVGFACWAGLSYHEFSGRPSRLRERIIEFEIAVQGLWWYTSCIKEVCLSRSLTSKAKKQLQDHVRAVIPQLARLKTIGATEVSSQRTMCEAVLTTSRLEGLVDDTLKLFGQL